MRRGVTVGKFWPPHRGHHHLIATAREAVDHLTVIVCRREGEVPDARLRAEWLREVHPEVEFLVIEDVYDANDSRLWAELTIGWLGGRPDVAFTSEDYGAPWAAYMDCAHVSVDPRRARFPVSGTAVRANPVACWEYLESCVRAYYVPRVVVVGAESTGTTTLASALAARYDTVRVPEYGRELSEAMMARDGAYRWTGEDFTAIAAEQSRREDAAARRANRLLVCDTDAFATSIRHERYLGSRSAAVDAIVAGRRCDLYLLTGLDVPFVQDGFRDGEHVREWMHGRFLAELRARRTPYTVLVGPHELRLATAAAEIERRWPELRPAPLPELEPAGAGRRS